MRISIKIRWIIILLIDALIFSLSLINTEVSLMTMVLIVWSNGIIYALEDLDKRAILLAFLLSFFLILIGREALEVFGLHDIETSFSLELNNLAESLVLLSLIMLYLGYAIAGKVKLRMKKNSSISEEQIDYESRHYKIIREVSSKLFYLTFAFNIFTMLDIVMFVLRNGYITYYTSYVSSVPYVIKKIGDMCLVCFWIFLATMPDRKHVNRLSLWYFIYLLVTLGTGKRFPFVAGILVLFVYYCLRNNINNGGNVWIKKKTLFLIVIAVPILILILYIIGKTRVNISLGGTNILQMFSDFFYEQGVSINVIKRAQVYQNSLPQGKFYLFGTTYEAISNNIVFRLLGFHQYSGNTIDHALNGYSFQHALSYAAMGSYYLSGHGLGSCYIAEAFHDLGYAGVILVNLVYGVLLRSLFDFKKHGIWGTAIILSMFYSFVLAPRGSADGFIADFVDLTTWGTIVVVWFLTNLLEQGRVEQKTVRKEMMGTKQ